MKEVILKLLIASVLVFLPIKSTLITVMVLTAVDLLSGIAAAVHRKERITSNGFKRTIVKIFVYELAVMLGYLTQTFMTGASIPVVNIIAGYIGITELKSVLENFEEITGIPVVKLIIDRLTKQESE